MRKIILMVSVIALLFSSASCGLSKTINLSSYNIKVTDFAVRLLQNTYNEDENILISPVSVLSDLSLAANSAQGDSLAQIEKVVGMTSEELNKYIYNYTNYLSRISNRKTKAYMEKSEMNQANSFRFEGVWDHGFGGIESPMVDRVDYSLEGIGINGFVKFFEKERYALAVLLPNQNMDTYINDLTGKELHGILSNPIEKEADIRIPKFSFSYEVNMNDVFKNIGVTDVLIEETENSLRLGEPVDDENIQCDNFFYISSIDMDINGINTERTAQTPPAIATYEAENSVYIDRPFIIIIMDCKYNLPLLIGSIVNV